MITQIKLSNFKCFESLKMPLKNLNLFSGINGMGKSTVIQSLLLLRQAYEKGSLEKGLYLNGEYAQIGTGKDLLYFNADGDIEISLYDENDEEHKWNFRYVQDADYLEVDESKSKDIDERKCSQLNLFNDNFEYIMAERIGPRKSYEKSFYDVQMRKHVGIHGEHAVYYLHRHAKDDVGSSNVIIGNGDKLKPQAEKWMSLISPGIQFDFNDVQTADVISLTIRQTENAALMGTIADYKPVNVGFGVSYALPIIIALLKAKKDDLIILENPEAHLHPKGQRMVGELIAKAAEGGAQIIVETHSDHILNGIRLSVKNKEIDRCKVNLCYFCVENENDITKHIYESPQIDEDGRLDFWPEGFFDEWDNVLLELL